MPAVKLLQTLRFWLFVAAFVSAVIELIVDAVALGALAGIPFSGEHKGAAGWTMFATAVSLIIIPLLAFGGYMASRGFGFAILLNRVLYELIIVVTLDVFVFVAGIVMANYASGCPSALSVCAKFKAATAFPWLSFFILLAQSVVVGLLLHLVRTNGGSVFTTLSYDVEGEFPVVSAAPPQHGSDPYPAPVQGAPSAAYYESQPQVSMPEPHGEKAV
ncbi:hypothetical protein LPJ53_003671 [Coemansia erecta]|uniref:Uncharacterized protein n=1 Tax=Coemansia erecta TaxID=147472 RepID=A0A9W7XYS3_9FUNG|nr:hypothetical protein LPJ53_003671 [Coemansia erecta]